jgi:hypothetical protein
MSNSRLLDRHLNNNICPDLKKGDRIVLIRMSDPISPVPPKSRGTVLNYGTSFLDDTIYSVRWDKSGSLGIVSNIDTLKDLDRKIERSNNESEIEKYKQNYYTHTLVAIGNSKEHNEEKIIKKLCNSSYIKED